MKPSQNIKGVWQVLGEWIKSAWTFSRAASNIWVKSGLILQAGIIDKYTGILSPEVGETASQIADKLPQILDVHTDIPWISDIVMSNPNIAEFANDVQNIGNIWAYMAAFALARLFSKYVMRGEKWRFEATTNTAVWTALSVGIFKEMSDVLNGYWHDIMSWLPLRAFEAMPESLREIMLDADTRRNVYTSALGVTWVWTSYLAIKNLVRSLLWPKKRKKN